jgi:hypothetical protein
MKRNHFKGQLRVILKLMRISNVDNFTKRHKNIFFNTFYAMKQKRHWYGTTFFTICLYLLESFSQNRH